MRVTTAQMYNTLLSGVKRQQDLQNQGNAQVSSGTRFQTPAQSGMDYKISLDLRHTQVTLQGDLNAVTTAESRLNSSMTMLNDMGNVLKRAQTIAVQLGTTGAGATERLSASQEATQLLNQLVSDANQKWQGQSLFAGTAVDKQAFVTDALGNTVYNGNAQDRSVITNNGVQIVSNVRGDDPAFASAITALEGLRTALQNNDTAGIQNAIGTLTAAGDAVVNLTSDVGARLNGVQLNKTAITDMQANLQQQLTTHEAADIPAVIAQIQQSNLALQASYNLVNQLKSLSLTNFLR